VSGDGKPDIVTANAGGGVSVLLGAAAGDGTFGAKTDYTAGSVPIAVAIADVNGDGTPDLAVANYTGTSVSILLGAGGAKMKEIASAARSDMERLFGGKVYLEVFVRVARGWADDDAQLKRFGY